MLRGCVWYVPCCVRKRARAVFNMLVRNAGSRGPMCFRCLMFSLSGPCELFFTWFYCLLDMSYGECDGISLYFMRCSVNGYVCLMCCVFYSVCELFCKTHRKILLLSAPALHRKWWRGLTPVSTNTGRWYPPYQPASGARWLTGWRWPLPFNQQMSHLHGSRP